MCSVDVNIPPVPFSNHTQQENLKTTINRTFKSFGIILKRKKINFQLLVNKYHVPDTDFVLPQQYLGNICRILPIG